MIALHGFLGRPTDWEGMLGPEWTCPNWLERGRPVRFGSADAPSATGDDIRPATPSESNCGKVSLPGVCDPGLISEDPSGVERIFEGGQGFNAYLDRLAKKLNRENDGDRLLGYSMGGRIALHMLLRQPQRWRRAIIVSASPGLAGVAEREPRLRNDEAWAQRFLHDDWSTVVRDWNGQSVFAHDPPDRLPRRESDFDRRALADALVLGSVARQADLREKLKTLDFPVLWVAGAKDAKYAALAQECAALNPHFKAKILDTGHRAPWGDPEGFRAAIDDFITIRT